jgi:hypothetical protein
MGKISRVFYSDHSLFLGQDEPTLGLDQTNLFNRYYACVIDPNHINAVVARVRDENCVHSRTFKFAKYYKDPTFEDTLPASCEPCGDLDSPTLVLDNEDDNGNPERRFGFARKTVATGSGGETGLPLPVLDPNDQKPVPPQFEMYDLDADPIESVNLAHPTNFKPENMSLLSFLARVLRRLSRQQFLVPTNTL